uniref:Uncharacterized protein n=1 Tax=Leishmania guyanensis TaxID=5670 RepID=A0A1E1IYV3_LEIGU|nr:hypothetical protein, conserved [Leishmania guyanensis]
MRSRRQTVSDAVSVLGMDPWKDDRVRDFVAINTIQRLRAYHLPASAPMPVVEEINTARALNLILLPRAVPDYRPCLGEQPPSRAQLRARRRAKERQERQELRRGQQEADGGDRQGGSLSESSSASASSSSSSDDGSSVGSDTVAEHGATMPMTNPSFHTDTITPNKQSGSRSPMASGSFIAATPSTRCAIDRARSIFFGALSFTSSTSPRRLVNSPHVPLTPSTPSTMALAGWSDMHVPRSPEEALLSTTASPLSSDTRVAQRLGGREVVAAATKDDSTTAVPPVLPALSATRSLGMELDAYTEANSTPLRPPPPMRHTGVFTEVQANKTAHTVTSAEFNASKSGMSPNTFVVASHETSTPTADVLRESTPAKAAATASPSATEQLPAALQAIPAAVGPLLPKLVGAEGDGATPPPPRHGRSSSGGAADIMHACDACDAIIQYYQSMLTRGVVLDRYNHKDLAFVWWVLGRNMDVAALENCGPLRREALMITLRNFYYTLLSTEEAKAKATAAEAEKSHIERGELERVGGAALSAAPGDQVSLPQSADATATGDDHGVAKDTEEHAMGASGKATAHSSSAAAACAAASVICRPSQTCTRDSYKTSASVAPATSRRRKNSSVGTGRGSDTTTLKRSRPDKPFVSSKSGNKELDGNPVEEDGGTGNDTIDEQELLPAMPTRGRSRASLLPKKAHKKGTTPESRRRTVAGGAPGISSNEREKGLAVTLGVEGDEETATAAAPEGSDNVLDRKADTLHMRIESGAASRVSLATMSRAGSLAQSSTGKSHRHHRCAAERNKIIEETWISTRTERRTAAIKVATKLELHGGAEAMTNRKPMEAGPSAAASRASRTATAKTSKEKTFATAAVKDVDDTAASVAPSAPSSGSATSKVQRRNSTALKRERSPSRESSTSESHGSHSSGGGGDVVPTTGEASGHTTEVPHPASYERARRGKNTTAARAKASAVRAEKANASSAAATTTSTKAGRGEEHRGRPRGSFKTPRISPPAIEDQGNCGLVSVARSSQRRRDGGAPSTTVLTGASSEMAVRDQRFDAVGIAVASPFPEPFKDGEGATPFEFPVSEIPLRLTPHERAVRSRIQQRMGMPLPAPPPRRSTGPISRDSNIDAQWPTVYSSYTFLLSSFRTAASTQRSYGGRSHERRAITAPFLWYGQAISPVVASESTSTSSSGVDYRRPASEKTVAVAVTSTRQRGRKRRIEGGVDPSLRGNVLWHDQAALERLVNGRLAQVAELGQAAVSRVVGGGQSKYCAAWSVIAHMKQEQRSGSEEEEKNDDEAHAKREEAAAVPAVGSPVPLTGSSPVVAATTSFDRVLRTGKDEAATGEEAPLPEQHPNNSAQHVLSPQTSDFGDLPYAQQCLLVWSAAGLLERHAHQRQMAAARRERLLARCSRMATRRMAARVAAVMQSGITDGDGCGNAEDVATQLAGELGGSDVDSNSGASEEESNVSEEERAVAEKACSCLLGRPSKASRKAEVEEHPSHLGRTSNQSTTSRSSSAASSSTSSEERLCRSIRPLPRRVYDYWAAYRSASECG